MVDNIPDPPVGLQLINETSNDFNPELCIICQTPDIKNKKGKAKSVSHPTQVGINSLKRAAEYKDDDVKKRLKILETEGKSFVYHNTNECFKKYVLGNKLKSTYTDTNVEVAETPPDIPVSKTEPMLRRSSITPRDQPSNDKSLNEKKCVICGKARTWSKRSSSYVREKYRLSTGDRGKKIIDAVRFLKDEVYCRVSDITSTNALYAADLYCHNQCFLKYYEKYERTNLPCVSVQTSQSSIQEKRKLFLLAIDRIDSVFDKGGSYTVSEIKDYMMTLSPNEELNIYNRDVKTFLIDHYGKNIQFAANTRKNESELVFSSNVTAADIATKIRNINVLKDAGEALRSSMMKVDFGLDDRFCDVDDLKKSWKETTIPDEWLTFYSSLFRISKALLLRMKGMQMVDEDEDDDSDENEDTEGCDESKNKFKSAEKQYMQLYSLFQTTYYKMMHGRKKTPLHVMIGQGTYGKTRSRELLTTLNKIGVSISYCEARRLRNLLCNYTLCSQNPDETPIPSHFSKGWTMGALDNENFEDNSSISGCHTKNYTAQVLYQDASEPSKSKPSVSSSRLSKSLPLCKNRLQCQTVPPYSKPVIRPSLPSTFMIVEDTDLTNDENDVAIQQSILVEFLITLIRCGLPISTKEPGELPPWAGIHALVTTHQAPLMRVGFMPVLPHPVTEYATVRKSLQNFQSVRRQLGQNIMPIFSDEGVFHIVVDVLMNEPDNFKDLFPMLGTFHMAKILLRCAGRYIAGSGIDDALIEGQVFGKKTMNSVLSGGHYVRSFKGMLIIAEALYSLVWQAFWARRTHDHVSIRRAIELKDILKTKNRDDCVSKFQSVLQTVNNLQNDFNDFLIECESKSELCQYFGIFLNIVNVIIQLITADRDGNWCLHVGAVRSSMCIFKEFDAINYLRYASFYLENIQILEAQYPSLYDRFRAGYFVVRDRKNAFFSAVAGDMKLEQSINRFSKGPGGHVVVGSSGDAAAVAEFELLYHEILSITNLMRKATNVGLMDHLETTIQHELRGKKGSLFDQNVSRLLDILRERSNPYIISLPHVTLHNILTQDVVDSKAKDRLLNALQNGQQGYDNFRKERYVEKTVKLSATISKVKLPSFAHHEDNHLTNKETKHMSISSKDIAIAQRQIEITTLRGMPPEEIYAHDFFNSSPLFDGDLVAKSNKSLLIAELEKQIHLDERDTFKNESSMTTHVLIDFMSQVRQFYGFQKCQDFGHAIREVLKAAERVATSDISHVIFDSYKDLSIKDSERIRRGSNHEAIHLADITESVPIPQQMEKNLVSAGNKEKLQLLARKVANFDNNRLVLSSMVVNDEIIPSQYMNFNENIEIPELNSWEEEADTRIILHTNWSVKMGCKRIIVLSNDADSIILLLRYILEFKKNGLKELWVRYATGEKRRMIPLHILHNVLGEELCHILVKVHAMTGNDALSAVGTKLAGLRSEPVYYLSSFGESPLLSESDLDLAEEYLVRVYNGTRSKTNATTFNELRYESQVRSTVVALDKLPPTSSVIRQHLKRAFFVIRQDITLLKLTRTLLDPIDYRWNIVDNYLLPDKGLNPFSDELAVLCGCSGKCVNPRCSCFKEGRLCVVYCHKKSVATQSNCINST